MNLLEPGTMLQGRYEVVRLIGKGGMGAVYEAVDNRLKNRVALKQTLVTEERLFKAFEREAQILASLRHPALTHVSDHFTDTYGQFLVMEFIPGEDLASLLEQHKQPFSLDQVMEWADRLLDALDYLHTQAIPIIHRDIKPQNLKLTPRNEIILLDFGLAKGSSVPQSRVTSSGSIFGYTPKYAPLEQIQGTGTDPRSDLYSLAATLYHLLTNVSPDDALQRAASVLNRQPDTLRSVSDINPSIPRAVSDVLAKAIALGAQDRYASASEMRQALHQARGQQPATGPTLTMPGPSGPQPAWPSHPAPQSHAPPPSSTHHRRFAYGEQTGQQAVSHPVQPPPPPQSQPGSVSPPAGPSASLPPPPPQTAREKKGDDWGKYCGFSVAGCFLLILLGICGFFGLAFLGASVDDDDDYARATATRRPQGTGEAIWATRVSPTEPATSSSPSFVPAGWSPLLRDSFDSNKNGWDEGEDNDEYSSGGQYITSGRYRWEAVAHQGFIWWTTPDMESVSDFVLSVRSRRVRGPKVTGEYGVIFRVSRSYEGDLNYYRFGVTDDKMFHIALQYNGERIQLIDWTDEDAINPGQENQLVVIARGSTFRFLINGEEIGLVEDATLQDGTAGLFISLDDGDEGVFEFDNFEVYAP
jgi:serine/threonine protein kinase